MGWANEKQTFFISIGCITGTAAKLAITMLITRSYYHCLGRHGHCFFFFISYIPLFWVVPYFAGTLGVHAIVYYFTHRHTHLNVEWGRRWLPWHHDHHMGKDQDLNWCVLFPLWDYVLGTRKNYFRKDLDKPS